MLFYTCQIEEKMSSNDLIVDETDYIPVTAQKTYDNLFYKNKVSFITFLVVVVFIYIAIFAIIGRTNADGSRNVMALLLEVSLWVLLIAIIYTNVKDMDFSSWRFDDLFYDGPIHPPGPPPPPPPPPKPCDDDDDSDDDGEVFHVFNNTHTYDEAHQICDIYGAKLATYDQVEKAYNNGAEWCSYGWSEGQMALFPTQKETWQKLQQVPGHENDCGRPGINGGYIANKSIKYGVNCYGKKPPQTDRDKMYDTQLDYTPAITEDQIDKILEEKKSKYVVAPFHNNQWSMFSSEMGESV